MCYLDFDESDVWVEHKRNARKEHRCDCCYRVIKPGEAYISHFSIFECEHSFEKLCLDCDHDRTEFGNAHNKTICNPKGLFYSIENCIYDDDEDEEGHQWIPMFDRIKMKREINI